MAHPSDPSAAAQVFVAAYRAANSAASERQRLAQSAQQQAMSHQIEQQRIAQSARESEARLATENAYHQQQAELKQQELAQEEKKAAMTAQMAFQKYQQSQREKEVARQFQAQQQKERLSEEARRQQVGIDARREQGLANAGKGVHVGHKLVDPNTGEVMFDADSDRVSEQDKMQFSRASKEMQEANTAMTHPWIRGDPEAMAEWKKKYDDAKSAADGVTAKYQKKQPAAPEAPTDAGADQTGMPSGLGLSGSNLTQPRLSIPSKGGTLSIGGEPAAAGETEAAPAGNEAPPAEFDPAPADPKDRETDTTYKTPKGLHTWTENGWVPYTPASQDEAAPDEGSNQTPPKDEGT